MLKRFLHISEKNSEKNGKEEIDSDARFESLQSKKTLREAHGLPIDMPVKNFFEYKANKKQKKEKGTKAGAWMIRKNKNLSKSTPWLFKVGGGYNPIGFQVPRVVIAEIHALKEVFASELYSLFLNNSVAKTRLAIRDEHFNQDAEKVSEYFSEDRFFIAIKMLKNFRDLIDYKKINHKDTIKKLTYQVCKALIISRILGEEDRKGENYGVGKVFHKVDHGESLKLVLDDEGNQTDLFEFTPANIADFSTLDTDIKDLKLSEAYFTKEFIELALKEICRVDFSPMIDAVDFSTILTICEKYEKLFDVYREKYGDKIASLIGSKSGTLTNLVCDNYQAILKVAKQNYVALNNTNTTPTVSVIKN